MNPLPLRQRLAAALGYVTFIPAGVLLFLPGYRTNQFVRFHAWQSVLLWGTSALLSVLAILISNLVGAVTLLLAGILVSLAMFFLWVVLLLKAFQGERFEIPLLGTLAGRLS